jgi:hypothetical protein
MIIFLYHDLYKLALNSMIGHHIIVTYLLEVQYPRIHAYIKALTKLMYPVYSTLYMYSHSLNITEYNNI